MDPIDRPEIMLSDTVQNTDVSGNVTNEQTRQIIKQLMEELVMWRL
jgi:hypothetical protein